MSQLFQNRGADSPCPALLTPPCAATHVSSDASTSSEECIESTTSTSSKQLLQQRQAALTRTYTKVQRVLPLDS